MAGAAYEVAHLGNGFAHDHNVSNEFTAEYILDYLVDLLTVTLGTSKSDLETGGSLLAHNELQNTSRRCQRFLLENQTAIYVHKYVLLGLHEHDLENGNGEGPRTTYRLSSKPPTSPAIAASVAILKAPQPIDESAPLGEQLQIVNLPGLDSIASTQAASHPSISPFQLLHSVVRSALAPYFDAISRHQQSIALSGAEDDSVRRVGIPAAKKRLAELELSLLQLQFNAEIPHVSLSLHPAVQAALDLAREEGSTPSVDHIPRAVLADTSFQNNLRSVVRGWVEAVKTLSETSRDPTRGTASQEINFWLDMEGALTEVRQQLEKDGVILTLKILKDANNFKTLVNFDQEAQLADTANLVRGHNLLLREFPLPELLSALSLETIRNSIETIFTHTHSKWRKSCNYPVRRVMYLFEAVSADLDERIHNVLSGKALMQLSYAEFQACLREVTQIWRFWDESVKRLSYAARERGKELHEKIDFKVAPHHLKTQERLRYIATFRHSHEQLQQTMHTVFHKEDFRETSGQSPSVAQPLQADLARMDPSHDIAEAYAVFKDVDVLDVTPEGIRNWERVENIYNERTSRVETAIISRLRDHLATARNANEMFRVFSKFNALFVRHRIRGAISEYQSQLIDNVKLDITKLQSRFSIEYGKSQTHAMDQLRDLPPLSGAIVRARQIERQLSNYVQRIEDVLGAQWDSHAEGQRLHKEIQSFRDKLDTTNLFTYWRTDVAQRDITIAGRLFDIERSGDGRNLLDVKVSFDKRVITLFKEVRNLAYLGFQMPDELDRLATDARHAYPFAVSLIDSIHVFLQTNQLVVDLPDVLVLLDPYRSNVVQAFGNGIELEWKAFASAQNDSTSISQAQEALGEDPSILNVASNDAVRFVHDFARDVALLRIKTNDIVGIQDHLQILLHSLENCAFAFEQFKQNLKSIQILVNRISQEQFANVENFVDTLNATITRTLGHRLREGLAAWSGHFADADANVQSGGTNIKPNNIAEQEAYGSPTIEHSLHELCIHNQVISVEPPLALARSIWLEQLHDWVKRICDLPRINLENRSTTKSNTAADAASPVNFQDLLLSCIDELDLTYGLIDNKEEEIRVFVEPWLQFQSLWDLQIDQVEAALSDDLEKWLELLQDMRRSRTTFDISVTRTDFGPISIDHAQVQVKINAKYDLWQDELHRRFAGKLGSQMALLSSDIEQAQHDIQDCPLDFTSTAAILKCITTLQHIKSVSESWPSEVEVFRVGQMTLQRQRFTFPSRWVFMEKLEHAWDTLQELLGRADRAVSAQAEGLRAKVLVESNSVLERITAIIGRWNAEKPVSGTSSPSEACHMLLQMETTITALVDEFDLLSRVREVLGLPRHPRSGLSELLEEVRDFKAVWTALSTIWDGINALRETPWAATQPRKVKQSLNNLVNISKDMPSGMRQYAAFDHVQGVIRQLLKANAVVTDLKSDAIRDRHWVQLFKALKSTTRFSQLSFTLGDVWDLRLVETEKIVRQVIIQAQGEMALEDYLRQVKEYWQEHSLDLVNYQNKCRLIRGWDDLFSKCADHANALQAMKHSPYFREFEDEATIWEDRVNSILATFNTWVDVQRQWVYLEGVFNGNNDIKLLLPVESSRFHSINTEYFAIMKKTQRSPLILDVLGIPGLEATLERLLELLKKIQKALGEYLERERAAFPRFYFVGDEDLLEIIGNSTDTSRVARHVSKMFAGISSLVVNAENEITSIRAAQGEEVTLSRLVSVAAMPKVNEWLSALDIAVKLTLVSMLDEALALYHNVFAKEGFSVSALNTLLSSFPTQITVLAGQIWWTNVVSSALDDSPDALQSIHKLHMAFLEHIAYLVGEDIELLQRKKCEQLITEFVFQRDAIEMLLDKRAASSTYYLWLLQLRFVYTPEAAPLKRLQVKMGNASLDYGFEYLGVTDRLVRTPLTERCFLTLTQALDQRLGGSPYGPAGTGKTETVKSLGTQLGRFTLVFNCDASFDFKAMGRIFLGICQVGAWGCFDEFNRLEERILSAVSQQIQNIQLGLKQLIQGTVAEVELVGRRFNISPDTGLFITMNPGYAGRSSLPDNLKKLFRSVAMSKPDKELIAEVTLFSQGFSKAREISKLTVPFFDACERQMSKQAHYDFGLRALKSVLVSSGALKRSRKLEIHDTTMEVFNTEQSIVLQSLHETINPKLLHEDAAVLSEIEAQTFSGVKYSITTLPGLYNALLTAAESANLVPNGAWLDKAIQLYQIQEHHHGVMMVGSSGSGKSSAWRVLLQALQLVDCVENVHYVIDPKVMSKEALYGSLDGTTREWTDGLFTSILRRIIDNLRGESGKRHWIVLDGDVDPDWVENLNSVLDDNRMLTLPNGERLKLTANVRILFEVENLRYATLATVSRCGMVWFNDDNVTNDMMFTRFLKMLKSKPIDETTEESADMEDSATEVLSVQVQVAGILETHIGKTNVLRRSLERAHQYHHIMEFTQQRALTTLFGLLRKAIRSILEYNSQHSEFPLEQDTIESFMVKKTLLAITWACTGDCTLSDRQNFGADIANLMHIELPQVSNETSLIDFDVHLPLSTWTPWAAQVPSTEVSTHSITQTDVVIPTIDTIRHEDILYGWLVEHKPLVLCGPPGSGKTMTLFSALRKLPDIEMVGLNFSSATTPALLLRSLEQHCEYRRTRGGVVLSPSRLGRWVVMFCDEINLPAQDLYGTQRVISFLRQLIERNGFWRTSDMTWVSLDRIQFVGACNPPTDIGRVPLSLRFLRHAPVIMVDYPGKASLGQIYGLFNDAILKVIPTLRGYAAALTEAMIDVYDASKNRFTPDIQPHYIYSPRELTRWMRGIYETILPLENITVDDLVRIWAHEALRLFQDRLLSDDERTWTDETVRRIALEHFPNISAEKSLGGPILFSNWLSQHYIPVDRSKLRDFVKARLRTFCEEEVDVPLVLYDDALDHILRIDRVFRQPQGHVILIGVSGSGKTTLSKFVAWINGLKVYQIKVHGKYSAEDFDEDLRSLLRRCGCKGEKVAFILDESNILDSAFLERMNTLLANAEIPGLFEGDDFAALMTACRDGAQRQGMLLDSQEELYAWFTKQISRNLHVVFTMNPPTEGLASRAATSPALFNRCVLNWFGDWSDTTLFQVATELTRSMDIERDGDKAPDTLPLACADLSLPLSHRSAIVNTMVHIHRSMFAINKRYQHQHSSVNHLTPRHFLDFAAQFVKLHGQKREELEDQQRHLNVGLDKLKDTVVKVRDLRKGLSGKKAELEVKNAEANDKLQKMVVDQQKAENTRKIALEFEVALEKQNLEINQRRAVVKADLAKAEPAVIEAQKSVNNIKRQHLTEVRSMSSPPASVKLALEAVCVLLGHKVDSWRAIQAIVRRDDFIATIVTYDSERMTPTHRAKMRKDFLSLEDFTYERVHRASKACGPLVQWVEAQVIYSEILESVGPLREEVRYLEDQKLDTQAQTIAVGQKIEQLEASISAYKLDYAALVAETEAIKSEIARVKQKVDRSMHLIDSLGSERKRWDDSSKIFDTQIETIAGDTLIAAAFLTYGGFYDQQYRKAMLEDWLQHLDESDIKHRSHTSMTEYLSSADERSDWQQQSLPADELCIENAIMLTNCNRYPLIIDPTGSIADFLRNHYNDRRLTITSFLDGNFTKQLEGALRFGGTLLLQDAEFLDPIINNILNHEYQKTGGRVLVQLGKHEIDFSPSFKLFLSTRDPSTKFSPDICSRTTLVNFTITQSSLYSQSLNYILRAERPDVDERRSNLLKMQGEFAQHLRQLERRLLNALNESKGNILDDDTIVDTLEVVKREVTAITAKAAETDGVMAEVEQITSQYRVVAQACSVIFAVLQQLRHLNHFYQFPLNFFQGILHHVLRVSKNDAGTHVDSKIRVPAIIKGLFATALRRTSTSMIQRDRITLALLLAQATPRSYDPALFEALLDTDLPSQDISAYSRDAQEALLRNALHHPILHEEAEEDSLTAWTDWLSHDLTGSPSLSSKVSAAESLNDDLRGLIVAKMLRADRLIPVTESFASKVFDINVVDSISDMQEVVDQISSSTPIALCCSPGFDASFRVDNLVAQHGLRCSSIAMGSNESIVSADTAISQAASSGSWVLLKNVHLAIGWLQSLEKKLIALKPSPAFRLFLSLEYSPKIPINMIRMSRVVMCEQPAGIRANMKDSTTSLSERAQKTPGERGRLYLLLSLVHAIIQERLRYVPSLGWSVSWEFNDSDYDCALHVIDTWLVHAAGTRSNIAPTNIPWEMLRALLISTYGGKIDSDEDLERLSRLVNNLFVPEAFNDGFDVLRAVGTSESDVKRDNDNDNNNDNDDDDDEDAISKEMEMAKRRKLELPAETNWTAFREWILQLPEREPPEWLGLPRDAEKVLLVEMGRRMIDGVRVVVRALEEGEVGMGGEV